jgi:MFS family permease
VCYTAPMVCASRWLPARKGLVSGFIVGGFGGGACMFGLLATAVLQWTPEARADALQSDGYYSAHAAIANAVPTLFVVLGLAYFVVVTVGAWLLEDSRHLIHAHHRYPATQDKPFVTMSDTYSKLQTGGVDDDIADVIDSRKSSPLRHGIEMASMEGTELKADSDSAMSPDFKTVGTGTGSGNGSNGSNGGAYDRVDTEACDYDAVGISMSAHSMGGFEDSADETHRTETPSSNSAPAGLNNVSKGPKEIIQDPLGWHVATCFALTALGGMFVAGTYKTYAQKYLETGNEEDGGSGNGGVEYFLSEVGSVGAVFNATGRILWGWIADKKGPIRTLIGMTLVFAALLMTYSLTLTAMEAKESAFAFWTFAILFCEGGNFALYMPVTIQMFGLTHAGSNYGLIFTCYSLVNVASISLMAALNLDFLHSTVAMGVVTLVGTANLVALRWHMRRKGLVPY